MLPNRKWTSVALGSIDLTSATAEMTKARKMTQTQVVDDPEIRIVLESNTTGARRTPSCSHASNGQATGASGEVKWARLAISRVALAVAMLAAASSQRYMQYPGERDAPHIQALWLLCQRVIRYKTFPQS